MMLMSYRSKLSLVDLLLQLHTYSIKIQFNTNIDRVIQQVRDILLYSYMRFSIADLQCIIYRLVKIARIELQKDLLLLDIDKDGRVARGVVDQLVIKQDKLEDNLVEIKLGQNLFKDKRNNFRGVKGAKQLSKQVVEEKRLREAFIDVKAIDIIVASRGGVVWVKKQVRKYNKVI